MSYRAHRSQLRSGARMRTAAVASIVVALSLTACGSGTPEAEAPILTIPEQVALAKSPVDEWPGPAESVTPPSGANLMILSCGEANTGCAIAAEAARDAAELLGWDATIVDGDSDLSTWDSASRQVAAGGYDAMIIMGATPELMSGDLARVVKAGIPIVGVFQPPFEGSPELNGYITVDHVASGDTLGKYILEDSGGAPKVMTLISTDFPETELRNVALKNAVKKHCADCDNVSRAFFDPANVSVRLSGQTTSLIQVTNPTPEYLVAAYDFTDHYVVEGIKGVEGAFFTKKGLEVPKFLSVDGSPEAIIRIKNGEQHAVVASPRTYMGWLAVDHVARLLAGQSIEKVVTAPERIIDQSNVGDITGDEGWQLEFDFESKFAELWGVQLER